MKFMEEIEFYLLLICSLVLILNQSIVSAEYGSDCIELKTRDDWGAQKADSVIYQTFPVQNIVIIHTVTRTCERFTICADIVHNIQHDHMRNRNFHDIAYNFLIGNDGNVYEGVGWHKVGSHTRNHNNFTIGIAFIGNFIEQLPSRAALDAAQIFLECGVETGELDPRYKLFGHKQLVATQSPGVALMREIRQWDHWCANP